MATLEELQESAEELKVASAKKYKDTERYQITVVNQKTGEVVKDLKDIRAFFVSVNNTEDPLQAVSGTVGPDVLASLIMCRLNEFVEDHVGRLNTGDKATFYKIKSWYEEAEEQLKLISGVK